MFKNNLPTHTAYFIITVVIALRKSDLPAAME